MGNLGPYNINKNSNVGPFPFNSDSEWNDINMNVITSRVPAVNNPSLTSLTTNTSLYTFAEGDYVDLGSIELLHGWEEGTELHAHIHVITNGEEAVETVALYTLYYTIANPMGVMSAEGNVTATITIPANTTTKSHMLVDFEPVIDATGYKIGSQFTARLKRVASAGTDPAAPPYVASVGLHMKFNTLGSRQETTK